MASGIRVRRKEEARRRIVDAAIALFDERGIDDTSVDDIAHAVGMSRATVFNYFPYKEAILVEIGARLVGEIATEAGAHRRRSSRRVLYDLADAIGGIVERHPALVAFIAREMTHPDAARRAYAAARMHYPMLYEALLADLAAAGRLRSRARIAAYGRQLVDLTTGTLVRAGTDFPVSELRAELRANVDVFWEGAVSPEE